MKKLGSENENLVESWSQKSNIERETNEKPKD